jgi:hypothetical protein
VVVEEHSRRRQPLKSIGGLAAQVAVVLGERREQAVVEEGLGHRCGAHRPVAALAAANSVANVSDDRCT